jgi:YbbR domain-containing protein
MNIMRWLGNNLTSLILSLLLAIVIWISAVTSANPNMEAELTIPFQVIQQPTNIAIVDQVPDFITVNVLAPESIIQQLNEDNPIFGFIDLANITAGTYRFPVQIDIPDQISPIRVLDQNPEKIELKISNLITKELPVLIQVNGEPAVGYQTSGISWEEDTVAVTGEENKVQEVTKVVGVLDISDATGSLAREVTLQPQDDLGNEVGEVVVDPKTVLVNQTITLQGGYRNLAVNVTTQGLVEPGYRFTSITPAPPTVMVFSEDPQLVEQLPGFVNTMPLDLTGVDDYLETFLELDLPPGVTVVGDPTVLVQVNVTALETNLLVTREIEVIGLTPGLDVEVSPSQISVSISGPVPVLDTLTERDIRVVVDLSELEVGVHTVTPTIEILPADVVWEDFSPDTVEIVITESN